MRQHLKLCCCRGLFQTPVLCLISNPSVSFQNTPLLARACCHHHFIPKWLWSSLSIKTHTCYTVGTCHARVHAHTHPLPSHTRIPGGELKQTANPWKMTLIRGVDYRSDRSLKHTRCVYRAAVSLAVVLNSFCPLTPIRERRDSESLQHVVRWWITWIGFCCIQMDEKCAKY